MSDARFQLDANPARSLLDALAALRPSNPLCTAAYFDAMRLSGQQAVVLMVHAGQSDLLGGCLASIRRGRLLARMDIPSAPAFDGDSVLWQGVDALGRRGEVHRIWVGTFGSEAGTSCALAGRSVARVYRSEFWLDLTAEDPFSRMGSNHRRNLKRAARAGYELRVAIDAHALRSHAALVDASTERRISRGSGEQTGFQQSFPAALLRTGAACLYQAGNGGEVASSMLALRSSTGTYYHSAGTTPDGMKQGASHFLVHEIARTLQAEGMARFNLGGVSPGQDGLRRFKTGFGATEIPLAATVASYGSAFRHQATAAIARVRRVLSRA